MLNFYTVPRISPDTSLKVYVELLHPSSLSKYSHQIVLPTSCLSLCVLQGAKEHRNGGMPGGKHQTFPQSKLHLGSRTRAQVELMTLTGYSGKRNNGKDSQQAVSILKVVDLAGHAHSESLLAEKMARRAHI